MHANINIAAILITSDKRLKLSDFGLYKLFNITRTSENQPLRQEIFDKFGVNPTNYNFHFDIFMLFLLFTAIVNLKTSFGALNLNDFMSDSGSSEIRFADRFYSKELCNFLSNLLSEDVKRNADINLIMRSPFFVKCLTEQSQFDVERRQSATSSELISLSETLQHQTCEHSNSPSQEFIVVQPAQNSNDSCVIASLTDQNSQIPLSATSDRNFLKFTSINSPPSGSMLNFEKTPKQATNILNEAEIGEDQGTRDIKPFIAHKKSKLSIQEFEKALITKPEIISQNKQFSKTKKLNKQLAFGFDRLFSNTQKSNKMKLNSAYKTRPSMASIERKLLPQKSRTSIQPNMQSFHIQQKQPLKKVFSDRGIKTLPQQRSLGDLCSHGLFSRSKAVKEPFKKKLVDCNKLLSQSLTSNLKKEASATSRQYIYKVPQNVKPSSMRDVLKKPLQSKPMQKKTILEIDFVIDERMKREISDELSEDEFRMFIQNAKRIIFSKGLSQVQKSMGSLRQLLELAYSVDPEMEILQKRPHLLPEFIALTIEVVKANSFW